MSAKSKTANPNTQVFVVWSAKGIDSVHATLQSASAHLSTNKGNFSIESTNIQGGTIVITEDKPAKAKSVAKSKTVKKEEEDDKEDTKPVATKKTKTPAEQRAANAAKPTKASDADLPDNVRVLLKHGGTVFEGKTVIVTGVLPTLGRKNTEKLVEAFGAHLGKSLSRKTDYVVVGNDAGPKKLLQIEELGLKTLDEDDLVALLENNNSGTKRAKSKDEEEEEEPKPKSKKQKK